MALTWTYKGWTIRSERVRDERIMTANRAGVALTPRIYPAWRVRRSLPLLEQEIDGIRQLEVGS